MALISQELLGRIRGVAEEYAEREKRRLSRADDAAWERIRVTDPGRYKARQADRFLVKTYYGDAGCIEDHTFETSAEALEYIRLCAHEHGPNDDYDYRYFGPNGESIMIEVSWLPMVRCK